MWAYIISKLILHFHLCYYNIPNLSFNRLNLPLVVAVMVLDVIFLCKINDRFQSCSVSITVNFNTKMLILPQINHKKKIFIYFFSHFIMSSL